jgi:hypothetical protein
MECRYVRAFFCTKDQLEIQSRKVNKHCTINKMETKKITAKIDFDFIWIDIYDYKCVVDWGDDVVVSRDIYNGSYCLSFSINKSA